MDYEAEKQKLIKQLAKDRGLNRTSIFTYLVFAAMAVGYVLLLLVFHPYGMG